MNRAHSSVAEIAENLPLGASIELTLKGAPGYVTKGKFLNYLPENKSFLYLVNGNMFGTELNISDIAEITVL